VSSCDSGCPCHTMEANLAVLSEADHEEGHHRRLPFHDMIADVKGGTLATTHARFGMTTILHCSLVTTEIRWSKE